MHGNLTAAMPFTGQHVLAELYGVDPGLLDDEALLREALSSALIEAKATVCEVVSKRFEPQGVTVLALLSESHASVHTYPEKGAAFVDIFTCGDRARPVEALRLLAERLHTDDVRSTVINRGVGA